MIRGFLTQPVFIHSGMVMGTLDISYCQPSFQRYFKYSSDTKPSTISSYSHVEGMNLLCNVCVYVQYDILPFWSVTKKTINFTRRWWEGFNDRITTLNARYPLIWIIRMAYKQFPYFPFCYYDESNNWNLGHTLQKKRCRIQYLY